MLLKFPLLVAMLFAVFLVACGGDDAVEATPTLEAATATVEIVKTPEPTATPTEVPPTATATQPPATQAPPTNTRVPVTPQPAATPRPVGPPNSGDWIDVNVSNYTVRLMRGTAVVQAIGPVGVGREIDTGVWESTATGLFEVYSMEEALVYDAPYDTYISHWVGFDPSLANGFHSFLKDKEGKVVDASTGNVSNGCIRTGGAEAIYAFAEYGMPVYVHF